MGECEYIHKYTLMYMYVIHPLSLSTVRANNSMSVTAYRVLEQEYLCVKERECQTFSTQYTKTPQHDRHVTHTLNAKSELERGLRNQSL